MEESDVQRDSFWESYRELHLRWEAECKKNDKQARDMCKHKTTVREANKQIAILQERCDLAEEALSDMGYYMKSESVDAEKRNIDRCNILKDLRQIQEKLEEERCRHDQARSAMKEKVKKLEEIIDDLRQQLDCKISEATSLEQERAILREENNEMSDMLKMEGGTLQTNACMRNAYDILLRTFISLFPQSLSENQWQFCDKKTGQCTPAFHLLISLSHEDLTTNVQDMLLIVKSPDDMVERSQSLCLQQTLCRYMRTIQWINAGLFTDIQEAIFKQSELTRHKILYENRELVSARQAFGCQLLRCLSTSTTQNPSNKQKEDTIRQREGKSVCLGYDK